MTLDDLDLFPSPADPRPGAAPARKWHRNPNPDPAIQRRNRRNKANGRGTSRDLAAYLGGRNVELLGLPWDVEAGGFLIQSKRDAEGMGPRRVLRLLAAIGARNDVAAVFHVAPRARLTSGRLWLRLAEWVAEHGWSLPPDAQLVNAGEPLIALPLATFRDLHLGRTA